MQQCPSACSPFEYSSSNINKMSLQRIVQKCTLLSKNHQCNRHFVRLRRKVTPELMDKHLDPEVNPSLCSKMNLVSQQEGDHIFITKYSGLGFSLHNGIRLAGPSVFFPRNCLKWKVYGASDINEKSLGLFTLLTPKLDLLIIGTGNKKQELHPETVKFLRKHQIIFDVLSTDQAIAAFNFQNNDQRWVAAALIPPEVGKNNLLSYVQNTYGEMLDSTDMIFKEEEDLPQIQSSHDKGTKKLKDSSVDGGQKQEQLKTAEDSEQLDIQYVSSPLGQSLDFLSSDSIERLQAKEKVEASETLDEKSSSEEVKPEEKKTE